jgi:hypothetical protein
MASMTSVTVIITRNHVSVSLNRELIRMRVVKRHQFFRRVGVHQAQQGKNYQLNFLFHILYLNVFLNYYLFYFLFKLW